MNARLTLLRDRAHLRVPDWSRHGAEAEKLMAAGRQACAASASVLMQEAHAFRHYYRHRELVISEPELIIGGNFWLEEASPVKPESFGHQQFDSVWFGEDMPAAVKCNFVDGFFRWAGNHTTMDFGVMLALGLDGLRAKIAERQARLTRVEDPDGEKREFLDALTIVGLGYRDFCTRHATAARVLAQSATSPARRAELATMAANCEQAIARPPRTFWEACQALWFAFFLLPDAPGRVDQYLYPYYRQDVDSGRLTPEFARELLSCLWIKYFESCGARAGLSAHNHLTLGGVTADGGDASNAVTYLCLDVMEELGLRRPQVGLRCHAGTPLPLLQRAVRALRSDCGSPDFCNDDQIVPALVSIGVTPEDARDFSLSGCHEVIVTGKSQMGSVEGFVNMPKLLRASLGLEPGMPAAELNGVTCFAAFEARLDAAMCQAAAQAHAASLCRDRWFADPHRESLAASLATSDCIANCRGYFRGGARYNFCNWNVIGLANVADSLAVIRRLCFEDKRMTLAEFAALLAADWAGREPLRRQIVNEFPHYGNDYREVDLLAADVVRRMTTAFKAFTPFRGGVYILGTTAGGENMHMEFGRVTGATPDGRKAGEPLADSMGAAQGRDRAGVTALLNSVAALPHRLLPTAATLNVRLDPKFLAADEGVAKIAAMIRAHFLSGGQQFQFNFVDRATLLAARRQPELHGNLMVRVAGYSAPFVSLWEELQDEIISRTEHPG